MDELPHSDLYEFVTPAMMERGRKTMDKILNDDLDNLIDENERLIEQFPDDISLKIGLRDLKAHRERIGRL